jgi:hypothetical protein
MARRLRSWSASKNEPTAKSKKPASKVSFTISAETSKPSLKARVVDELLEILRSKSKSERQEIGDAINRVLENWGRPHRHSGIGIRRLAKTIFECRLGLDDRHAFVFIASPAELVFLFIGNNDEIQKLIRSNR